jgi:golgin subfamily B member 1
MHEPPRQRGSIPPLVLSALDHKLEGEVEILEALLTALSRNQLQPEMWERLFTAARRDERLAELAFAFEAVLSDKKIKSISSPAVGEFMFQAALFFGDVFGDEHGAVGHLEKALAASPAHAGAFSKLESKLVAAKEHKKLSDLYADAAAHRPRAEQAPLLRQASVELGKTGTGGERMVELHQQVLRLDPADEQTRFQLEALLARLGRPRDAARVLEQGLLVAEPAPSVEAARHMRSHLIELYADELGEIEKAVPHVEALLALDPASVKARQVAEQLLELKGVAARAAAALAEAHDAVGRPEDVARFLAIELEHTRGAKRRDVLRRLALLRQDKLGDPNGAFDVMEQALTLDPADDDLRVRYVVLATSLGRQLDGARLLAKVTATAKDPPVRARLAADVAELFTSGGDRKRGRAVFASVLTMAGATPDTILKAATALVPFYEADGEIKPLADVLERIAQAETDPARLRAANEKLAELAMGALADPDRAIVAWRRVLEASSATAAQEPRGARAVDPSRARALAALEELYGGTARETASPADLAFVLEERSKDAPPSEGRELLARAATSLESAGDAPKALGAWRRYIERFGASRDVNARYVPLLEAAGAWVDLATALEGEAALSPESERGAILGRAGIVRLQRLREVPAAIDVFRRALAADAGERTSRGALEKLLAAGEHRVSAANALEPIYRAEDFFTGLLRVLEVKATNATSSAERLGALDEAARVAESSPPHQASALDFAGRGLAEATSSAQPIESWIERVLSLSKEGEAKRRAAIFSKALGEKAVDSQSLLHLAGHTGDALAAVGDVQAAIEVFRRALAYDPSSSDLIARVDTLLRDQGSVHERVGLYRSALERETNPLQRRKLFHAIGAIDRHELGDLAGAIEAYRRALGEEDADGRDRDAHAALVELYTETGAHADLIALLEKSLGERTGSDALKIRAQLAEIAAQHGDVDRAIEHCVAILEDAAVGVEELDSIARVADTIHKPELECASLEKRAALAGDPRDAIAALDRLGTVRKDKEGNVGDAIEAWKRAARLAEDGSELDSARRLYERVRKISPFDAECTERLADLLAKQEKWSALPELYAVLVDSATTSEARCDVLGKLASVLAYKLGDLSGAADVAGRAFAIDPRSPATLASFERLAVLAGVTLPFSRAIDAALEGVGPDDEGLRQDLLLAKGRVLAKDPTGHDDAATIYKNIIETASLDATRSAAVLSFEKLLDTTETNDARRTDRRWLLSWRAEHAPHEDKVAQLLAWARAEETLFSDVAEALGIHRRILELDPENVEAAAASARLTLASGDVSGAIAALVERRERSDGAAKRAIDLEIATILIERNEQLDDALASVTSVLDDAVDDADAVALAARFLRLPAAAAPRDVVVDGQTAPTLAHQAAAALERACERATTPDVRAAILSALLEAPPEMSGSETRKAWFGDLALAQQEQGKAEAALLTTLRGAEEFPTSLDFWDRAEELARELKTPGGVADLYYRVISTMQSPEDAYEVGQRAVAFQEEWFDDPTRIVAILERVLAIDPAASWAFDRLKLLFDSREQWDDLFGLYDRAIAAASELERRVELLEDAAQTAKDFANHSERAIGYLQQLLPLKRETSSSTRIIASLERLYERHGRHRELIALLSVQLTTLGAAEGRDTRIRIASLSLDNLAEPAAALAVIEEVLAPDPKDNPQLRALGDPTSKTRMIVVELLERILVVAPRGQETRESMLPPPMSDRPPSMTPPPGSVRAAEKSSGSMAPPRSRAKRTPVRQRAAALLKEHYVDTGRDADLAKVLEVELEAIKSVKERIRRHRQVAQLHVKLGNDTAALEHYIALVTLEPDVPAHREALGGLAERVNRFDRFAEVLTTAADDCTDDSLRVELLMQAATVHEDKLGDPTRAIELYLRLLAVAAATAEAMLAASRRVDPLLLAAARPRERLTVLERMSDLESEPRARREALGAAAHLAADLDEHDRAITAWETRLADDDSDAEALDGLVALLEQGQRWEPLVTALTRRATAGLSDTQRRADRVHIARVYADHLDQVDAAIEAWRAIDAEFFGASEESTRALAGLLERTQRWEELATLLDAAATRESAPETRATLLRQLGDVRRLRLADSEGAIKSYEGALGADQHEPGALDGLHALLDDETHRAAAIAALLWNYGITDAWRPVLDLTEHRLLAARTDAVRVRVLQEAAQLAEHRANDTGAAYELVCRAFELAPSNLGLEDQLFRLAEISADANGWRAFADVHRRAIEKLEAAQAGLPRREAELLARLRIHLGEALERRLDDPRGALIAYLRAVNDSPADLEATRAAVRVAGPNGRWDAAAKVILHYALATGALDESLFGTLESVATTPASWDGATGAFAAAIAQKQDIPPALARDLEARIAAWHRDRRGDPDAAEAAFTRALVHDSVNAEILSSLAQLQRRAKGRPLVDSLLRLSQATGGDLELLREAAEIATSAVADRALAKSILEKLIKLAAEMWLGRNDVDQLAITAGNGPPPDSYVRWAVGELIRIHNEEGDAEKIVDLLVDASALPFDAETRRSMRHQAARVAVDRIGDDLRAISLYAALFAEDGGDAEAARQLAALYATLDRNADLLDLRRRQIELASGVETRLVLRLEASRLEVGLERFSDAITTLQASLKEEPRHAETVDALVAVLVAGGKSADLAQLLAEQAELAEAAVEKEVAAVFWSRAAGVAEEKLSDEGAAIAYHARVVALAANSTSYDALARLSAVRQDFAGAAEYLAQLRELAPTTERVPVTLRLVDALTSAGREDLAQLRLEESVAQDPEAEELRARLAEIYRKREYWAPLAGLLAGGVDHLPGKAEQLARLREAADLYRFQCALPESAVPLLERAADLDPADRAIRLTLADTLGAAGKLEEARTLLRLLIDGFGGRRPKERAPVHYHLARLDLRAGDRAQALGELEAATRIDPANAEILRAVAELARDDGALERAERSYRALLAVVRRQDDPDETAAIVRSEVLLELSDIARRQGEAERAEEIRESALESAVSHPVEAARLERALRAREDWSTLAKALELRLARDSSAAILFELADILGNKLGRPEDAFGAALRAIELSPTSESSHEAMLALARRAQPEGGGATVERYADTLATLARNAETAGDTPLATALYLRLASTVEIELKDDARAATLLEQAERLGCESGDVLRALERLYARLGDLERQGKILQRLIDLEDKATPRNDARVADANLRLASLRLASGDADEASLLVSAALDLDPSAEAAVTLLQQAVTLHPTHEFTLDLYERVARRPGQQRALLDALRRRAELPEPHTVALREAVALANELSETDIAEAVLRRYVEIVRTDVAERSHAVWAFTSLAAHAEAKNELRDAVLLRLEAADIADDDEARSLRFAAAHVATESLSDSALAATIYEKLLVDRPGDRAAWEPLAAIYRGSATGAPEARRRLAKVLGGVVTEVEDDQERLGLRLERARLLLEPDSGASAGEGERELQTILDEDPTNEEAGATLVTLLEQRGAETELAEVLRRQLDVAKDKANAQRVSSLATRLGPLVEKTDPTEAIEIYKTALEWDAANQTILRALFRLMQAHGDATDRADVTERLLAVSSGPDAEKMALDLAAMREEMADADGIERALFLGYKSFPASAPLHDRLLAIYTERSDWAKLAEVHILDASAQGGGVERAALLRKAATIFRIQLADPKRATTLMKEARLSAPADAGLFEELVTTLTEAGNFQAAAAEITAAAAHLSENDPARAALLARRASLRAALGDHGGALYDLERAHALNPAAYVGVLAAQLEHLRDEARGQRDAAKETALILRLAGLLQRSGQFDAARRHLTDLLSRDADNKEALRSLGALEESLERWDAATAAYRRLALLEDGRDLGETALSLANVSEKAGELPQARAGLERALHADPENTAVRERLRDLYARTGAHRELAQMSLSAARLAQEDDLRFVHLLHGASALLEHGIDPKIALEALEEARAIRPRDIETTALLADAYLMLGQRDLASEMLNATLVAHKGRRSRDLALLHQRLSRIERANANPAAAMTWLSSALDMDGQNGVVASELAMLALEQGNFDLAAKALRAVTMLKAPAPMSKALAYQHLGEIAHHQGDVKKAMLLLKRAVDDDPTLESARMLLTSLQTQ